MELRRSVELCIYRISAAGAHEVLMSQRGPNKHGAGAFAVPGGHLDKKGQRWETYAEATVREVEEELGRPLANAVKKAFAEDRVNIVTIADDLREETEPQVHYVHLTLAIEVPYGIEADASAQDSSAEHVGLTWLTKPEINQLVHQGKIYASQLQQIKYFLDDRHQYTQLHGLK